MRKSAYNWGREMIWSNVARNYVRTFEQRGWKVPRCRENRLPPRHWTQQPRELPDLKLDHFARMTDSTAFPACHPDGAELWRGYAQTTTPALTSDGVAR